MKIQIVRLQGQDNVGCARGKDQKDEVKSSTLPADETDNKTNYYIYDAEDLCSIDLKNCITSYMRYYILDDFLRKSTKTIDVNKIKA